MNHEIPSLEKEPIKENDPIRIVEYDFQDVPKILRHFQETPEELERILQDPVLFFSLLRGMDRVTASDHPEKERQRNEKTSGLVDMLRHADIVGEGTSNIFRVPKDEPSRTILREHFGKNVGLRELKRAEIIDLKTGSPYLGIPTNHDQPDPVGAFRRGSMAQAVTATTKGILPDIYHYAEEHGARDRRTGRIIPGLEDEIVGMTTVMEVLNGPSVAKIIDRDGVFWNRRYSARNPVEIIDFLKSGEYREYIRNSIEDSVTKWPGLLDIDWENLGDVFEDKMRFLNSLEGGISTLLRDGHFGNTAIIFADEDGHVPDPRTIALMDPDLSSFSIRPGFGDRLSDYLNEAKSTSLGEQFFMPDHLSEADTSRQPLRKVLTMDAVTHHRFMFSIIGETVRDIRKKRSSDRIRARA